MTEEHGLFTTGQSALLHELVQGPYRQIVREFAASTGYLELRQLLLLYVWSVAIATTIFGEAGRLSEDEADAHVSAEAEFSAATLMPALAKDYARFLSADDELPDADDFLEAYQSALLFLAYRVDEDSDAEDVVGEYFESAHDLGQYHNPGRIDEDKFADALFNLFVALGDTALDATNENKGLN